MDRNQPWYRPVNQENSGGNTSSDLSSVDNRLSRSQDSNQGNGSLSGTGRQHPGRQSVNLDTARNCNSYYANGYLMPRNGAYHPVHPTYSCYQHHATMLHGNGLGYHVPYHPPHHFDPSIVPRYGSLPTHPTPMETPNSEQLNSIQRTSKSNEVPSPLATIRSGSKRANTTHYFPHPKFSTYNTLLEAETYLEEAYGGYIGSEKCIRSGGTTMIGGKNVHQDHMVKANRYRCFNDDCPFRAQIRRSSPHVASLNFNRVTFQIFIRTTTCHNHSLTKQAPHQKDIYSLPPFFQHVVKCFIDDQVRRCGRSLLSIPPSEVTGYVFTSVMESHPLYQDQIDTLEKRSHLSGQINSHLNRRKKMHIEGALRVDSVLNQDSLSRILHGYRLVVPNGYTPRDDYDSPDQIAEALKVPGHEAGHMFLFSLSEGEVHERYKQKVVGDKPSRLNQFEIQTEKSFFAMSTTSLWQLMHFASRRPGTRQLSVDGTGGTCQDLAPTIVVGALSQKYREESDDVTSSLRPLCYIKASECIHAYLLTLYYLRYICWRLFRLDLRMDSGTSDNNDATVSANVFFHRKAELCDDPSGFGSKERFQTLLGTCTVGRDLKSVIGMSDDEPLLGTESTHRQRRSYGAGILADADNVQSRASTPNRDPSFTFCEKPSPSMDACTLSDDHRHKHIGDDNTHASCDLPIVSQLTQDDSQVEPNKLHLTQDSEVEESCSPQESPCCQPFPEYYSDSSVSDKNTGARKRRYDDMEDSVDDSFLPEDEYGPFLYNGRKISIPILPLMFFQVTLGVTLCWFHVVQHWIHNNSFVAKFKNKSFGNPKTMTRKKKDRKQKKKGIGEKVREVNAFVHVCWIHHCRTADQAAAMAYCVIMDWIQRGEQAAANLFYNSYLKSPKNVWYYAVTGEQGCFPTNCPMESNNHHSIKGGNNPVKSNASPETYIIDTLPRLLKNDVIKGMDPCTMEYPTTCSRLMVGVTACMSESVDIVQFVDPHGNKCWLSNVMAYIGIPITPKRIRDYSESLLGNISHFMDPLDSEFGKYTNAGRRMHRATRGFCRLTTKDNTIVGDCMCCWKKMGFGCPAASILRSRFHKFPSPLEQKRKVKANTRGKAGKALVRKSLPSMYVKGRPSTLTKRRAPPVMLKDDKEYLLSLPPRLLRDTVDYLGLLWAHPSLETKKEVPMHELKSLLIEFHSNPVAFRERQSCYAALMQVEENDYEDDVSVTMSEDSFDIMDSMGIIEVDDDILDVLMNADSEDNEAEDVFN